MIYRNPSSITDLYQAFNILLHISELYPGFNEWYWDKVVPGIINGQDKMIIAENRGELVGISIIKKGEEDKLRALRITEKYQKKGYGLYLIDQSLKELDNPRPVVSVAEEMINQYSRIFINRYGFDISHVYNSLYRKGKLEYEFNGVASLKEKSVYF